MYTQSALRTNPHDHLPLKGRPQLASKTSVTVTICYVSAYKMRGVLCTAHRVRINSSYIFVVLCVSKTLEAYLFLERNFVLRVPKFGDRPIVIIEQGGNSQSDIQRRRNYYNRSIFLL